ncbi:MAG: sialate O-acetylesterase, partial [Trueperaceae bacterium]
SPNVSANQAFGALDVQASGGLDVSIPVGNITILIAGQSNAVGWDPAIPFDMVTPEDWPEVRMLGNDYVWKGAYEPGDDATGQLDSISPDASAGASPGVELGRQLTYAPATSPAAGRLVYLIPSALGGSGLGAWNQGVPNTDRSTLFGSAAYRGLMSAGLRSDPTTANDFDAEGGPVLAVYWYQGETDSRNNTLRGNFASYTAALWDGFRTRLDDSGREPVVIYAQLASHGTSVNGTEGVVLHRQHADVAERQRRLEQGAWVAPTAALDPPTAIQPQLDSHMVVTHDLPRSDRIHLSAEGQRELGQRIALAVREHVLGEAVDGTGPRIVAASRSGNVLTIVTDQAIAQTSAIGPNGFASYFTVYDGPPSPDNIDAVTYGTNTVTITDVRRDPSNDHAIRITLASSSTNPYVRYMRPFVDSVTAPRIPDVVRSADSGLPLPAFGPIAIP